MYPQQQQQQQVVLANTGMAGQPVIVAMPPPVTDYKIYNSRQSLVVGIILIVAGVMSIVFNTLAFTRWEGFCFVGHGFWCGAMFIVAGGFGIGAMGKSKCPVIAFLVLAIISASFAATMCGLSVPGAIIGTDRYDRYEVGIFSALMAVAAFVAGVASIWGSVLGCRVFCCGRRDAGVTLGPLEPVVVYSHCSQQQQQTHNGQIYVN